MPRKKKETAMIYESPDGGATVYARPVNGKGERVLIEQPNFPDWYMNCLLYTSPSPRDFG